MLRYKSKYYTKTLELYAIKFGDIKLTIKNKNNNKVKMKSLHKDVCSLHRWQSLRFALAKKFIVFN